MAGNRLVALLLAACMGLVLAGCGEGESAAEPRPRQSPTGPTTSDDPTPEPTPTRTERARPKPPRPPVAGNTPAGRRAFARHVVDAWTYALRTNDPRPLVQLSAKRKPCTGCEQLRRELQRRDRQGWYVDLSRVPVRRIEVEKVGGAFVAAMRVAIPRSDSYHRDGSYRSTSPAHPRARFGVELRFVDDSFKLVSFRVTQ